MTFRGNEVGVQVRVLGPVDVVDSEGNDIGLGGPVQASLLSLLVAAAPRPVAISDIIVEIWAGAELPDNPVAAVRTYVARLRRALGPDGVLTRTSAYALGDVQTDARQFEELVDKAREATEPPAAARLWQAAVGCWRGPAFRDDADIGLIQPRIQRLEELRAEASEGWFDARLAIGEARELVADLNLAVKQYPLREAFRAQQMTALARVGRQADALRAFQDFRCYIGELGLEPSPRMVGLDAEIASGAQLSTPLPQRSQRPSSRCRHHHRQLGQIRRHWDQSRPQY